MWPHTARGFSLLELLVALVIGLALVAMFLVVLQRCRLLFASNESIAQLQDSARLAMAVLVLDIEHAGFFGFAPPRGFQLVANGRLLAEESAMRQPTAELPATEVAGLPAGAHACGVNFAVDLLRPVQGTDNGYDPLACEPTASAGGARESSDTLTIRHASLGVTDPRAGRVQLYSSALGSQPLLLFADGLTPGARDDRHQVSDLEVRSYYVANNSVGRTGFPALRVKSLTESGGAAQFRDEELVPGVEDLQVELGVAGADGAAPVRFVAADSPAAHSEQVVAVRLWLRLRAETTEPGHQDAGTLTYANTSFSPDEAQARQRRMVISRTIALRNRQP
jgi:type IV pilus assembly protein PilW